MTTALPWERWQPEPVEPEPPDPDTPPDPGPGHPDIDLLPYEPPVIRPPRGPDKGELGQITQDALDDALEELWPTVKEKALGYVKDSWEGIREGQTVDVLHPEITAVDVSGKELVVADAKSRSWRTLVQGLIFDVFFAIVASVAVLSGADPFVKETWVAFGVLLLKSVVSAVISYFMRLKVTPTIKTPGEKMAIMPVPRPMMEEQ